MTKHVLWLFLNTPTNYDHWAKKGTQWIHSIMSELKANNFKTENSIWDKDSGTTATIANFSLIENDYHATTHCLLSKFVNI